MSVLVFPTQVNPDCPKNFWKSFLDKISSTVKAKGNKAPPLKTIKGVFGKMLFIKDKALQSVIDSMTHAEERNYSKVIILPQNTC